MIIDSHTHYGNSPWGNYSAQKVYEIISDSVDFAICSNLEGIDSVDFKDERDCNLDIIKVCEKYPKFKPLAVCQVNKTKDSSVIRELLESYPEFAGLKFHPECMKLPADSSAYDSYLELAREFRKPVLYHSGHIKSRFSSPYLIYKKAKEFPDVPIILGHLSTGPKQCHIEAIEILIDSILTKSANLYVDTSWIDFAYERLNDTYEDTLMLIERLKDIQGEDYASRIMWASDVPVGEFNSTGELYSRNLNIFIQRVRERFNDETLLKNLLGLNCARLYGLA